MIRMEFIRTIHTKSGRRRMVIPGARRLMMVAMKFTPEATVPMPTTKSPTAQYDIPCRDEKSRPESGEYANQPASGAPARAKL